MARMVRMLKCVAPLAVAKLGRPAGRRQPIKERQQKAKVQGRKVHSAQSIAKARSTSAASTAKRTNGLGSPAQCRGSKAARRAKKLAKAAA
jgi:hypothetical protein